MAGQVVVLVPGFLGFARIGALNYFADRVLSALRGALETLLGQAVPVVGVETDPVGSLASRQASLLRELAALEGRMGAPVRFHLVGHSTGGVDAELLTCASPLAGGDWGEHAGLRRRIASVTTLAAPHYGSCLAASRAAGWLLRPWSLRGSAEASQLVAELLKLLASRSVSLEGLEAVVLDAGGTARFAERLLTRRQLLRDLLPDPMAELRRANPPDPALEVPVRCFATVTPPTAVAGAPRACDGFFATLHRLTATYARQRSSVETERFVAALQGCGRRIANPAAALAPFDASANDGLVDSARQVLETHAPGKDPAAALAAVVVGDHGDVLGYYDRQDALAGGRPLDQSFLRSGAGFGDDQFFELWDDVARHVARAVEAGPDQLPKARRRRARQAARSLTRAGRRADEQPGPRGRRP